MSSPPPKIHISQRCEFEPRSNMTSPEITCQPHSLCCWFWYQLSIVGWDNFQSPLQEFGYPLRRAFSSRGNHCINTACCTAPRARGNLCLLFQFMYPQRQPNLKQLEFRTLSALAEAAEKYQVFSALDICSVYMRFVVAVVTLRAKIVWYNLMLS